MAVAGAATVAREVLVDRCAHARLGAAAWRHGLATTTPAGDARCAQPATLRGKRRTSLLADRGEPGPFSAGGYNGGGGGGYGGGGGGYQGGGGQGGW
jgi:hypothetical protein